MGPVSSRQRHTPTGHTLFFSSCESGLSVRTRYASINDKRMCRNTFFCVCRFDVLWIFCVCDVSLCHIFDCPFMVLITEVVSLSSRRLYTTSAHTYCLTAVVHVFLALSLYLFTVWHDRRVQGTNVDSSVQRTQLTHEVNRSNHLFFEREKLHACWQTIINGHLVTASVADVN